MKKIKSGARYIDRTLVKHHFKIFLCKSEKELYLELANLHVPLKDYPEWLSPDAFANTHTLIMPTKKNQKPKRYVIVCIRPRDKNYVSHLIHEAVHVWWLEVNLIQEEMPSEELEAYSISAIATNLIEAYTGKKIK